MNNIKSTSTGREWGRVAATAEIGSRSRTICCAEFTHTFKKHIFSNWKVWSMNMELRGVRRGACQEQRREREFFFFFFFFSLPS